MENKKNLWDRFNPTITEFLERNKNKTMVGMFWSMLWRFYVAVYVGLIAFCLVITLLISLFS